MHIPSPDAAMLGLAERLARILQGAGMRLPTILAPLPFCQPLGGGLIGWLFFRNGDQTSQLIGGVFWIMSVVDGLAAAAALRRRLSDLRRWGPERVQAYGALALINRAGNPFHRLASLVFAIASAVLTAVTLPTYGLAALPALLGFNLWTWGRLAEAYGECVPPIEQSDAGAPVPGR